MGFEYTIKAIPTEYNGVMFRSRLEASWAAFFDCTSIAWDYEPLDMSGWTPDFIIHGGQDARSETLVEVKPVYLGGTSCIGFNAIEKPFVHADIFSKAISHSEDHPVMLLGLRPVVRDSVVLSSGKIAHYTYLGMQTRKNKWNEYRMRADCFGVKPCDVSDSWAIAKNKVQKQYA